MGGPSGHWPGLIIPRSHFCCCSIQITQEAKMTSQWLCPAWTSLQCSPPTGCQLTAKLREGGGGLAWNSHNNSSTLRPKIGNPMRRRVSQKNPMICILMTRGRGQQHQDYAVDPLTTMFGTDVQSFAVKVYLSLLLITGRVRKPLLSKSLSTHFKGKTCWCDNTFFFPLPCPLLL